MLSISSAAAAFHAPALARSSLNVRMEVAMPPPEAEAPPPLPKIKVCSARASACHHPRTRTAPRLLATMLARRLEISHQTLLV